MNLDSSHWYQEHLKPHEPMLLAWLSARFATSEEAEDILQEALLRVMKASSTREIKSPKAFLFVTAKNLALMRLRQYRVRNQVSLAGFEGMDIFSNDEDDVSEKIAQGEELEMLTAAIQSLPTRCRQILTLRKIYGMPQKQIAKELGISENTVESQTSIGMFKLSKYFRQHHDCYNRS